MGNIDWSAIKNIDWSSPLNKKLAIEIGSSLLGAGIGGTVSALAFKKHKLLYGLLGGLLGGGTGFGAAYGTNKLIDKYKEMKQPISSKDVKKNQAKPHDKYGTFDLNFSLKPDSYFLTLRTNAGVPKDKFNDLLGTAHTALNALRYVPGMDIPGDSLNITDKALLTLRPHLAGLILNHIGIDSGGLFGSKHPAYDKANLWLIRRGSLNANNYKYGKLSSLPVPKLVIDKLLPDKLKLLLQFGNLMANTDNDNNNGTV